MGTTLILIIGAVYLTYFVTLILLDNRAKTKAQLGEDSIGLRKLETNFWPGGSILDPNLPSLQNAIEVRSHASEEKRDENARQEVNAKLEEKLGAKANVESEQELDLEKELKLEAEREGKVESDQKRELEQEEYPLTPRVHPFAKDPKRTSEKRSGGEGSEGISSDFKILEIRIPRRKPAQAPRKLARRVVLKLGSLSGNSDQLTISDQPTISDPLSNTDSDQDPRSSGESTPLLKASRVKSETISKAPKRPAKPPVKTRPKLEGEAAVLKQLTQNSKASNGAYSPEEWKALIATADAKIVVEEISGVKIYRPE